MSEIELREVQLKMLDISQEKKKKMILENGVSLNWEDVYYVLLSEGRIKRGSSPKVIEELIRGIIIGRASKKEEVYINEAVLERLRELPCITPILGDWEKELCISQGGKLNLGKLFELNYKMLDIQRKISSIGLRDGFVPDLNLLNRNVYGSLSDFAWCLMSEDYCEELEELIEVLECEIKSIDKKREVLLSGMKRMTKTGYKSSLGELWNFDKEIQGKEEDVCQMKEALLDKDKNKLFSLYWEKKLLKGSKLLYYNLLLEVVAVYLYNFSLHLSEIIVKECRVESLQDELIALSKYFLSRIMPSIREKMKKTQPKISKEIFVGFDTEYKNIAYGENKLVSAQLAVTGNLVLEIRLQTPFKYDTIHTVTLENIKTDKLAHLEELKISTELLCVYIDKSVSMIRSLLYCNYDESIKSLISRINKINKLQMRKIEFDDKILCITEKLPIVKKLLLKKDVGLKFESLISEAVDVSCINEDLDRELSFVEESLNKEVISELNICQRVEELSESYICQRELADYEKRTIKLNGLKVGVENRVYLISHYNVADLSMIEDWNEVKFQKVDIIGKSYVSIKSCIKFKGYNIYIRDSMLLASAAAQSLKQLGLMHGIEKPNLDEKSVIDMELFVQEDPGKFREYAINDSLIVLHHGLFVSNFANELGKVGIPSTLGSLARLCLQKYWDDKGYRGYQANPEYILGDSVKVSTPLGVNHLGSLGSVYSMFIGSFKGGRNESFVYGITGENYNDWDITSCYTTIMAMLGNPDYKNGCFLTQELLEKKSGIELMNSYSVMLVDFKHAPQVKYPIIPVLSKNEASSWVYCMEGNDVIITGLEYLKLRELGSKISVKSCYFIPFEGKKTEGGTVYVNKPFEGFIKYVQGERRKYKKGLSQERMWKDIGNMCYGSSVTGLSNKQKYNPRTDQTERMVGNHMSNPLIGSWITGYVRCLIGESLNNIDSLGGKVVSVTTDGFCTNLSSDVDPKLDVDCNLDVKNGLMINKYCIEDQFLALGVEKNTFLIRAREARLGLTSGIKGKDSDPSVWELKCSVKGITQWSTRGQCSHFDDSWRPTVEKPWEKNQPCVIAATGYSRRGKNHEELDIEFQGLMKSEHKEVSYVQRSLVGANLNYKKGLQCTPNLSVKSFKTVIDGRRRVIIPEDIREKYLDKGLSLPMDRIYETEAFQEVWESSQVRGVMKSWKQSKYVHYCTKLLPSIKEYEDFNERSVLVDCLAGRAIDVTEKDPRSTNFGKKREIYIEEPVEVIAKFRAYKRHLEILNKKLEFIEKTLKEIEWEVLKLKRGNQEFEYRTKPKEDKRSLNKVSIYNAELKRLKSLFASLKIYGLWHRMGKAGGEVSIDLCSYLRSSVLYRFLPPCNRGGII